MEPAFLLPLESESEDDIERHSLGYLTGVLLCLYTATVVSLANILQVRLMSRPQGEEEACWTSHHLMIVSGQSPPPLCSLSTCDDPRCVECAAGSALAPSTPRSPTLRSPHPCLGPRPGAAWLGAADPHRGVAHRVRSIRAAAPHPGHHAQVHGDLPQPGLGVPLLGPRPTPRLSSGITSGNYLLRTFIFYINISC